MNAKAKATVTVSTRVTLETYERFLKVLEARSKLNQPISIRDAVEFALLEWICIQESEIN